MAAGAFSLYFWLFVWLVVLVYTYWNESRVTWESGQQPIGFGPDEPPISSAGPLLVIVFGCLASWSYIQFDAIYVVGDALGSADLPDTLAMTLWVAPPIAMTILTITAASVGRARSYPEERIGAFSITALCVQGLRAATVEVAPFVAIGTILLAVVSRWNSLAAVAATAAVLFLCWEFVRYQSAIGWGKGVRTATDEERAQVAAILDGELPDRNAIRIYATDADWPIWALRAERFDYRILGRIAIDEAVLHDTGSRADVIRAYIRETHRSRFTWTAFLARFFRAVAVTTTLLAAIPYVPPTPSAGRVTLGVLGVGVLWAALVLHFWNRWHELDRAVADDVGRAHVLAFHEDASEYVSFPLWWELYDLCPSFERRIAALEDESHGEDSPDEPAEGSGANVG